MSDARYVWLLGAYSPTFHVVGVFTTHELAVQALGGLPQRDSYSLFQIPVDRFVGFVDRNGRIQDGMGRLNHEHFMPDDEH